MLSKSSKILITVIGAAVGIGVITGASILIPRLVNKLVNYDPNALPVVAEVNGLKIAEEGNAYVISGNNGALSGAVTVPAEYGGRPITAILEGAFDECDAVTSLTVPDGYTRIESGAFEGLENLQSLTVPFLGGSPIAEKHEAVLGFPFGYIEWRDGLPRDGLVPKGEFSDDTPMASMSPPTDKVFQYSECFMEGVHNGHSVLFYAYKVPASLHEITVTNQTKLPTAAFRNLTNVTKVSYTKGVEEIGRCAVQGCSSLVYFNSNDGATVDLRGSCKEIGESAFEGCSLIAYLRFPETSQAGDVALKKIGAHAFKGLGQVLSVTLPDTLSEIGIGAFEGCNRLSTITLPFVGKSENTANANEKVFGYIFGCREKSLGGFEGHVEEKGFSVDELPTEQAVEGFTLQYAESSFSNAQTDTHSTTFYLYGVPETLTQITVTKQTKIPFAAFRNLEHVTFVGYRVDVSQVGEHAFDGCGVPLYQRIY